MKTKITFALTVFLVTFGIMKAQTSSSLPNHGDLTFFKGLQIGKDYSTSLTETKNIFIGGLNNKTGTISWNAFPTNTTPSNAYGNFNWSTQDQHAAQINYDYWTGRMVFRFSNPSLVSSTSSNYNNSIAESDWINALTINQNGTVNIGTVSGCTNYKLTVDGKIGCRELKVTQASWCDYVFKPTYKLLSIDSLDKYIKTNKHLPNIPSAKYIETNGIDVKEMLILQMQKIEELTLYVIELQRQNLILENKINVFKTTK